MIRIFTFITLLLCFAFSSRAQSSFPVDSLEILLLQGINQYRIENGLDSLDSHEILVKAAEHHAEYMAGNEKADPDEGKRKYRNTGKRVVAYGGTSKADELIFSQTIQKGKSTLSARAVAATCINKWKTSKKERLLLLSPNYVFAGPGVLADEKGKKAYISIVLGSYNTFNTGADKRRELDAPYSKKAKKLKPYDAKACRNCEKFKDVTGLQQGLYVEGNKIYLKYDNLRAFKKLMRKPKDALAVDIVQRAQYEKADYNIMDNNLVCKGVLLKRIYSKKLLKKNKAEPDKKGRVKSLLVELGTVPSNIDGPYELNLLIIQDNKVCKTIMRSYIEGGDQASSTPLEMLPMPESIGIAPAFEPRGESTILTFTVPFERGKFDYKQEDIEPFLKSLQEPDFFIDGLYIYAYSSIEGDSVTNAKLQRKRGESIINAFNEIQPDSKINTNIITNDSWGLFILQMEEGPYDYLTKMTKREAIRTINSKGLANELEPYLAKQRFAQIVLDITYDVTGPKEEKFAVFQFNRAVKNSDMKQAYKIEEFIAKNIRNTRYSPESWDQLEIPKDAKFSGLLMNKVYYRYSMNSKIVTEEDQAELKELVKIDPANPYIAFNDLFCSVKLDSVGDKAAIDEMQKKIDALYSTNLPRKNVDALNIEFQFKIMDAMDTVEGAEPVIQACIEKIKSFYNMKEASWQNSLKLAYEFIRFKDYRFAASLLEPYVKQDKVDEQLLFTYISLCAQVPERIKSRMFVLAMQKARQVNPDRYCKLIGEPFLTFQVLDNPHVKGDYMKAGCGK